MELKGENVKQNQPSLYFQIFFAKRRPFHEKQMDSIEEKKTIHKKMIMVILLSLFFFPIPRSAFAQILEYPAINIVTHEALVTCAEAISAGYNSDPADQNAVIQQVDQMMDYGINYRLPEDIQTFCVRIYFLYKRMFSIHDRDWKNYDIENLAKTLYTGNPKRIIPENYSLEDTITELLNFVHAMPDISYKRNESAIVYGEPNNSYYSTISKQASYLNNTMLKEELIAALREKLIEKFYLQGKIDDEFCDSISSVERNNPDKPCFNILNEYNTVITDTLAYLGAINSESQMKIVLPAEDREIADKLIADQVEYCSNLDMNDSVSVIMCSDAGSKFKEYIKGKLAAMRNGTVPENTPDAFYVNGEITYYQSGLNFSSNCIESLDLFYECVDKAGFDFQNGIYASKETIIETDNSEKDVYESDTSQSGNYTL